MSTERDALPCPFCGHVGLDFNEGSTFRWLAYSCGGCGTGNETRVQTLGEGAQEQWREQAARDAVEQWNCRAALAKKPALSDQQRVDAERYRWLRDVAAASIYVSQPFICGAGDLALSGADADSAVDAAILAAQEKQP